MASNQRARLYGGMAHSVALRGYQATSVSDVIRLAGVSRTTFYELFANKHDCFLAAYETMSYRMIKNIHGSCRSCGGDWLRALNSAFDALRAEVMCETSAARMVIFEAPPAGPDAIQRSRKVRGVFEHMLQQILSLSPAGPAISCTLVKALTGGVRSVLHPRLYPGNLPELDAATYELALWALAYHAPEAEADRKLNHCSTQSRSNSELLGGYPSSPQARALARECAQGGGSQARPAGARDVVIDRFHEAAERGCRSVDWIAEQAPAWPTELGESIRALACFIAVNPSFGRMSFAEISKPGPEIGARTHELFGEFRALLERGRELSEPPRSAIAGEAVAGAVWESIHHHVSLGRTHSFAELSEELTYIALAPFTGSREARRLLSQRMGSSRQAQSAVA